MNIINVNNVSFFIQVDMLTLIYMLSTIIMIIISYYVCKQSNNGIYLLLLGDINLISLEHRLAVLQTHYSFYTYPYIHIFIIIIHLILDDLVF